MTAYDTAKLVEMFRHRTMKKDLYRQLVLPLFFKLEPELAHHVAMDGLRFAGHLPFGRQALAAVFDRPDPRLESKVCGLHFPNPIGMAAGYDKNAQAIRELGALGFGHIEVGTVTPKPQVGNTFPRIFRLIDDDGVINRMGFPNQGADKLEPRLKKVFRHPGRARVGVNIGKQRETPLEEAAEDYCILIRRFHNLADFLAINVSSPNTPNLRKLQARHALQPLLREMALERQRVCPDKPWFLKIAPDLTEEELEDILDVAQAAGISGIIATNTTLSRQGLVTPGRVCKEAGGMSGPALQRQSTEIIRTIYRLTAGKLPIIGVGGVNSVESALEKIQAGASLVQVYTGLIYEGPGLVRTINQGLVRYMDQAGVNSISELVGTA